jgi:hypothetical protein
MSYRIHKFGENGMNEHVREEDGHRARTASTEAIGRELFGETVAADQVAIAIYVNGRLIHTKTDSATVQRIMALLTGLGG